MSIMNIYIHHENKASLHNKLCQRTWSSWVLHWWHEQRIALHWGKFLWYHRKFFLSVPIYMIFPTTMGFALRACISVCNALEKYENPQSIRGVFNSATSAAGGTWAAAVTSMGCSDGGTWTTAVTLVEAGSNNASPSCSVTAPGWSTKAGTTAACGTCNCSICLRKPVCIACTWRDSPVGG